MAKNERIYSFTQLLHALRSSVSAVQDQLQVLELLNDSATPCPPGILQAVSDLEFVVETSAGIFKRQEEVTLGMEGRVRSAETEALSLRERAKKSEKSCEQLQKQLADALKANDEMKSKFESCSEEVSQQKQSLWSLEKHRADLLYDCEKLKQDSEHLEGEAKHLRTSSLEANNAMATLKQELAARNSDALHLRQQSHEIIKSRDMFKKQVDGYRTELQRLQGGIEQERAERVFVEEENQRLSKELLALSKEVEALEKKLAAATADAVRHEQSARQRGADAAGFKKHVHVLELQLAGLQRQMKEKGDDRGQLWKRLEDNNAKMEVMEKELLQAQVWQKV
eukprot:gene15956-22089_t